MFASLRWSLCFSTLICSLIAAEFGGANDGREKHQDEDESRHKLDSELQEVLRKSGFTGRMESSLENRLGRPIDMQRADLGRNLFFDKFIGLHGDNTCAGCHSPTAGFGDTQSIAIGIDNNNLVGPHRAGPRNQRRTPSVVNSAFYPKLMWNGRFQALSGNPFDNSAGLLFPLPEGLTLSYQPNLLSAQAFIPPTERIEMAGFEFPGNNDDIRDKVIAKLNESAAYTALFNQVFPNLPNGQISYDQFALAIAEFQISLTLANAPIDQYARGDTSALSESQKRGALLFFGKAKCVSCHAVSGISNEMFSDFQNHVLAVPQIVPSITNAAFDGPGQNEDFGMEQVTGNSADRYRFRTSPLRNVALQPTFFHNGAFTTLENAIRHHLNVEKSVRNYQPASHVAADLSGPLAPMKPVLARLDKRLKNEIKLSSEEFQQLVSFVRYSLLDPRTLLLEGLIPQQLISGITPLEFE